MQLLLYACEMLGVEQVPSYKCYEATGQRKALSREACWTSEYSHLQTWQRYGHCRPIHLRLILPNLGSHDGLVQIHMQISSAPELSATLCTDGGLEYPDTEAVYGGNLQSPSALYYRCSHSLFLKLSKNRPSFPSFCGKDDYT